MKIRRLAIILIVILFLNIAYSYASTSKESMQNQLTLQQSAGEDVRKWLGIFIGPLTTLGVAWFITRRLVERDRELAEQQRKENDRRIDEQNKQEVLKSYMDKMTSLLIDNELSKQEYESPIVQVAKALTLTVLRELDANRNQQLIRFLHNAKLIQKDSNAALFRDANLSGVDLRGTYLTGADMRASYLIHTDLRGAILNEADLAGADLTGADLRETFRGGTIMENALYADASTPEKLYSTIYTNYSLIGIEFRETIFPDNFNPEEAGMQKIEKFLHWS